jgi:predicted amidohydrolase
MHDLKVALIQADLVWENPHKNRQNFTVKIDAIEEDVDLIILPEMFTTGFTMQPYDVSETMKGETIVWLLKLAKVKNCAITGSLIIKENQQYFNRLVFVDPSGEIETYDKRHTFTLAGEEKVYSAGTEKLLLTYKGWKICPLICYDLRFPVWARNTEDYDLLLYVANWPKPRISAWDALLKARAIENMSYCIGVNRVGIDPNNYEYDGHSAGYNCLGESISNIEPSHEQTEIITLSALHLKQTREQLQFLNDKDNFTLRSD